MAVQTGDVQGIGTYGWYENEGGGGLPAPDAPVLSVENRTATLVIASWTTGGHADNYKIYLDGARFPDASTTFLSSPQTVTGLSASTAYTLKVAASNTTDDTDSNTVSFTTPAGSPILSRFESEAVTLIESMTTVGGYNYDWGDCNIEDHAKKDAYPNCEINVLTETNNDDEDNVHSKAYENDATIEIAVYGKISNASAPSNPVYTINDYHNKALDDLKRLFGINLHVNDTVNAILYTGSTRERFTRSGDVHIPGKLTTTWKISYAQDRQSPEVNAN